MPNQKHQPLTETDPAATLGDATTRLQAARDALAAAEARIAAFDLAAAQEAEETAQEAVRVADEALGTALADGDEKAITAAREHRGKATEAWSAARGRADDRRAALRALERRRDAAAAEQDNAQAAFDEAQAGWLRGELKAAQAAYAEAAERTRGAYARVRAVHFRLRVALGDAGRAMTMPDTSIRLPRIGTFPAFEDSHGTHVDAASEALKGELARLTRGGA